MEDKKKVIFSGIQPSGNLTIGNYYGAIKNWVKLQDEYDCFYCVVDMHAITVRQEPMDLRRRTLEVLSLYVAAGVDPDKNTLFIQSHVPAHAEIAWLLNCYTYIGELSRMTQFKDKSARYGDASVSAGLFDYPALMAGDILLYNTDLVPVGIDQKQHIELTRDLAERFNNAYSPTLNIPEIYLGETGAKVMDLQEPAKKMSKSSDNPNSYILMMDPPEVIRKKISRSVTDSIGVVKYNDEQPGIKNLMTLMNCATGMSFEDMERKYEGQGYAQFKIDVAEALIEDLGPIQKKALELVEDKAQLEAIYRKGAEKASAVANKTVRKMMKKIGFIPR
ncbi:MAG TPA: tryptophan--tRNA ligase [Clostridiaceae bacterium]